MTRKRREAFIDKETIGKNLDNKENNKNNKNNSDIPTNSSQSSSESIPGISVTEPNPSQDSFKRTRSLNAEDFVRENFNLPADSTVIDEFPCSHANKENGRMFVTQSFLCFASVSSPIKDFQLPFRKVIDIRKKNSNFFLPNALEVTVSGSNKKYLFTSIADRDEVFEILKRAWLAAMRRHMKNEMEQMESDEKTAPLTNSARIQEVNSGNNHGDHDNDDDDDSKTEPILRRRNTLNAGELTPFEGNIVRSRSASMKEDPFYRKDSDSNSQSNDSVKDNYNNDINDHDENDNIEKENFSQGSETNLYSSRQNSEQYEENENQKNDRNETLNKKNQNSEDDDNDNDNNNQKDSLSVNDAQSSGQSEDLTSITETDFESDEEAAVGFPFSAFGDEDFTAFDHSPAFSEELNSYELYDNDIDSKDIFPVPNVEMKTVLTEEYPVSASQFYHLVFSNLSLFMRDWHERCGDMEVNIDPWGGAVPGVPHIRSITYKTQKKSSYLRPARPKREWYETQRVLIGKENSGPDKMSHIIMHSSILPAQFSKGYQVEMKAYIVNRKASVMSPERKMCRLEMKLGVNYLKHSFRQNHHRNKILDRYTKRINHLSRLAREVALYFLNYSCNETQCLTALGIWYQFKLNTSNNPSGEQPKVSSSSQTSSRTSSSYTHNSTDHNIDSDAKETAPATKETSNRQSNTSESLPVNNHNEKQVEKTDDNNNRDPSKHKKKTHKKKKKKRTSALSNSNISNTTSDTNTASNQEQPNNDDSDISRKSSTSSIRKHSFKQDNNNNNNNNLNQFNSKTTKDDSLFWVMINTIISVLTTCFEYLPQILALVKLIPLQPFLAILSCFIVVGSCAMQLKVVSKITSVENNVGAVSLRMEEQRDFIIQSMNEYYALREKEKESKRNEEQKNGAHDEFERHHDIFVLQDFWNKRLSKFRSLLSVSPKQGDDLTVYDVDFMFNAIIRDLHNGKENDNNNNDDNDDIIFASENINSQLKYDHKKRKGKKRNSNDREKMEWEKLRYLSDAKNSRLRWMWIGTLILIGCVTALVYFKK